MPVKISEEAIREMEELGARMVSEEMDSFGEGFMVEISPIDLRIDGIPQDFEIQGDLVSLLDGDWLIMGDTYLKVKEKDPWKKESINIQEYL